MNTGLRIVAALSVVGILIPAIATTETAHHSPYAGQENRRIASLSEADIAELMRGGGWGLARSAELNGLPGPAHLLEMKDEIGLSGAQERIILAVRDAMREEAQALGRELVDLERALDEGFWADTHTPDSLRAALTQIEVVRGALRFAHLSAHLQTPDILTERQIAQYNDLRGYTNASDPCANVPTGHNAAMWRKHNGCE